MYGDEGKGLMVDYFASQKPLNKVVVRYNGSSQAGHTVVCPNSTRHIFSHFSSGTFVQCETLLSEDFVVHPILFKKEFLELTSKGLRPLVYAHEDCLVTTPYDMLINQIIESRRGKFRHGSVGVGFGETFERDCYMSIKVSDLFGNRDSLKERLMLIRDRWVPSRIQRCEGEHEKSMFDAIKSDALLNNFLSDCKFFTDRANILYYDKWTHKDLIFEGAQGLMLDQTFGFFPHVTRSNTGLKNIIKVLDHFKVEELRVNHISRAYTTRHGAGPLEFEQDFPDNIIDNTNHAHVFQGNLRYSPLNLDDMQNVISQDYDSVHELHKYDLVEETTITCMDQVKVNDTVPLIFNGRMQQIPTKEFEEGIKNSATYMSYGPTRDHVWRVVG
jgi:adenylosuccinate synthase